LALLSLLCDVTQEIKDQQQKPVEGKIILMTAEGYSGFQSVGDPVILLRMRTEKIYGCINYQIAHSLTTTLDRVDVTVWGVEIGDICLTALGPATSVDRLDLTRGAYTLLVSVNAGTGTVADVSALRITDTT